MKKHLAIICGIYYPNPSPTGLCTRRYAKLLADEYDIEIICMSNGEAAQTLVDENGFTVHILAGKRMAAEYKSKGVFKKLIHLHGALQIKTKLLGNLRWYRRAACKKLNEINCKRKLDAVLTVCSPFAAHFAGMDFKKDHPDVTWCGYTVDPYAAKNRIRPIGCTFKKLVEKEAAVLSFMDAVFVSEEVYKNRPELYRHSNNCKTLPYLLPDFNTGGSKNKRFNDSDINCVYAGSFYRDIRNPETMLSCFSGLADTNIKLHLYARGCEDIVAKYSALADNIVMHDRVGADEIAEVYREADILVNIGNATPEFLPSKTFEYIASGKPIIHYYYEGMKDGILDKYPLCLQLRIKSKDTSGDVLLNYIHENRNKIVASDEVESIYTKHSKANIREILLNSCLKNATLQQGDIK